MTPPWTSREQQASICTGTCTQIKHELLRTLLGQQAWLDICPLCTNSPCNCVPLETWESFESEDFEEAEMAYGHFTADGEFVDTGPKWVCANCGQPSGEMGHSVRGEWACKSYNPGSEGAIQRGCTCPRGDNAGGRGYLGTYGVWVKRADCPLHGSKPEVPV